jgi:hypothetical protein
MIENCSEMMASVSKKDRESKWIEGRKMSKQMVKQKNVHQRGNVGVSASV